MNFKMFSFISSYTCSTPTIEDTGIEMKPRTMKCVKKIFDLDFNALSHPPQPLIIVRNYA